QQSLLNEQASLGAALLAGVGAGLYPDLAAACRQTVHYGPVTDPHLERQAQYREIYARFVQLYPRLREDFHWLAGLR
ncbi:MAG: xylulokinase, partial [Anaerolineales bacterium]|nr:xylulokinase [Anaerolineales bacterium]